MCILLCQIIHKSVAEGKGVWLNEKSNIQGSCFFRIKYQCFQYNKFELDSLRAISAMESNGKKNSDIKMLSRL